jgi:hypothetical protein
MCMNLEDPIIEIGQGQDQDQDHLTIKIKMKIIRLNTAKIKIDMKLMKEINTDKNMITKIHKSLINLRLLLFLAHLV